MTMKKTIAIVACIAMAMGMTAQMSRWSYGLQAGVAAHATTGTLNDNFKGAVGFTGGLTADRDRLRLKADVTYCQPSFKNPNMYGILDEQGRDAQINAAANASHIGTSLQVGYTVARMGAVSLTPCAGIYYSHYSWKLNDIEWKKDENQLDYYSITDNYNTTQGRLSWIASIDVDIRLHDAYTDLMGPQQRLRSSLRITPWVTHISHNAVVPSVKGMQLGISVAYSGLLSSLE